jgi:serine/threonine protein kinase
MTTPLAADRDGRPDTPRLPEWEASTAFVDWDETLPTGSALRDYQIRSVIGETPYAVVYAAWDHALRRPVAIKEYLPRELAARRRGALAIEVKRGASPVSFGIGLKAFIAEGRLLARFDHPALVHVYRFWEENGTAYRAMPLLEGPTLGHALEGKHHEEAEVRTWLRPLLDALSTMHAAKVWHHHVVPANVVLTPSGPVLLDLAATRRVLGALGAGPSAVATPGYSAPEQYTDTATLDPGPWTDLYGLAALAYRAVAGAPPPPASQRLVADTYIPLARIAVERCSVGFVAAIDAALALAPAERPRDDTVFRSLMGGMSSAPPTIPIGVPRDLMTEPFSGADADREVTVPIPAHRPEREAEARPEPDAGPVSIQIPVSSLPPSIPPPLDVSVISRATLEAAAPLPFERHEIRLGRNVMLAIGAGVIVLGGIAAAVLFRHGGAPEPAPTSNPASVSAAPSPAVVAATPAAPRPPAPESPPPAPPTAIAPTSAQTAETTSATEANTPPAAAASPAPTSTTPASTTPVATTAAPTPTIPVATNAAPAPQSTAARGDSRAIDVATPPATDKERRERCADLLQEATLRRLSPPESAFFRKECR